MRIDSGSRTRPKLEGTYSTDSTATRAHTHIEPRLRWCSIASSVFWGLQSRLSPLRCRMDSALLRPWGTPPGTTVAQCATMDRLGKRPALSCVAFLSTPPALFCSEMVYVPSQHLSRISLTHARAYLPTDTHPLLLHNAAQLPLLCAHGDDNI
jgi:hypothetical protein